MTLKEGKIKFGLPAGGIRKCLLFFLYINIVHYSTVDHALLAATVVQIWVVVASSSKKMKPLFA